MPGDFNIRIDKPSDSLSSESNTYTRQMNYVRYRLFPQKSLTTYSTYNSRAT